MRLLDEGKLSAILPFFDKEATFQQKIVTRNAIGEEIEEWHDVEGLVGLKCAIGDVPLNDLERGEFVEKRCLFLDYDLVDGVSTEFSIVIGTSRFDIIRRIESQSEDVVEFAIRKWI